MKLSELLVEPRVLEGLAEPSLHAIGAASRALPKTSPLRAALDALASSPQFRGRLIPLTTHAALMDLGTGPALPPGLVAAMLRSGADAPSVAPVVWVAWGLERASVNLFLAPLLGKISAAIGPGTDSDEILDIIGSKSFADSIIEPSVRVEHALTPLSYRIYPDTPIPEIQHLMLRRDLAAVPVVGQDLELLGMITRRDLLPLTVPKSEGMESAEAQAVLARDVMSRSVLCVSEEEELLEASRSMVSRGVSQLPVVREGELIGFLTSDTVMRAFAESVDA